MKIWVFVLIFVIGYDGYGHDIRMAVFEISRSEGEKDMGIAITIDKEDFLRTLFISSGVRSSTNESLKKEAQNYFESNLTIWINGTCTCFKITSAEVGKNNIRLNGVFETTDAIIHEVQVENYSMFDVVEDQENIVHLNLNDRQRSFRMNREKIKIVATYS